MYKGLETGERNVVAHVIKLNKIILVFKSALNPSNAEVSSLLEKHGDHVKDIAFSVYDLDSIVARAVEQGAKIVKNIWEEKDENGTVRMATLQTVSISLQFSCNLNLIQIYLFSTVM